MATIFASRLESMRRAAGFSQRVLAESAGITRQAVGAIESGRMQPGVGIALRLARGLDTTVEALFGPDAEPAPLPARVAVATIAGMSVTHALEGDHLAMEPAESPAATTVFIAGCDPAVGLLARHATARNRDARVLWLTMTNRAALSALARGEVHAAVVHGDAAGDAMKRGVDAAMKRSGDSLLRIELATSEEGWLLARGNPLCVRSAADLLRTHARLVNRPKGAGARALLDVQLRHAAIDSRHVAGYARELPGQLDAGRAVAQGFADAAVGMAGVARLFRLDFIPLRHERSALLVPRAAVRTPEIALLLDALRSNAYRRDLEALQSYDVTNTGERIA